MLLSGRGSNFVAIARNIERGRIPAEIVGVVSNVADAEGLERAREMGLRTYAAPHAPGISREAQEAKVIEALVESRADWILLAGYMRLLSKTFVDRYPQRILNIHPSLLPSFPGLHPQRQALAAGVKISGCTVHFVDAGLDSGPIVLQRAVPVEDADDEEALSARILAEEHLAYSDALCALLRSSWRIHGGRVLFEKGLPGG